MAVLQVTPANEHYIVVLIELCISKHLVEASFEPVALWYNHMHPVWGNRSKSNVRM